MPALSPEARGTGGPGRLGRDLCSKKNLRSCAGLCLLFLVLAACQEYGSKKKEAGEFCSCLHGAAPRTSGKVSGKFWVP